MHGSIEDVGSWILTQKELQGLLKKEGYKDLVRSLLTLNTVLFIGITVDDQSVGGHLSDLQKLGIVGGPHFWLTSRRDIETDSWAENLGIRIIRYEAASGDHSAVAEFFEDIMRFFPKDSEAPPVLLQNKLPFVGAQRPEELMKLSAEDIREQLNAEATEILRESTIDAYERFNLFCEEYEEAIYRAWYVSLKPVSNKILGYTLKEKIATGAFGTVYRAISPNGDQVALKLLRNDVRTHEEALQSFRRGIRSMKILSRAKVDGMVPFLDASEIPAFVVMRWVDGPDLKQVVQSRSIKDWSTFLDIAVKLGSIIREAHRLPERVLHRDLRPSNVLLEGFWSDAANWRLMVTDFDLSWHLGAQERSIIQGWSSTGYLAPEQMQKIQGVTTRSAAVDSFGFGMTLFFILSARDPLPTEHKHNNWAITVKRAANNWRPSSWKSLSARVVRLIINCTHHSQPARWDMAQALGELERLQAAILNPRGVRSAELIAEEVAARSRWGEYKFSNDSFTAHRELGTGGRIIIEGKESKSQIVLTAEWLHSGTSIRKNIRKWLPQAEQKITSMMQRQGWKVGELSRGSGALRVEGHKSTAGLIGSLKRSAELIDHITNILAFE